MAKDLSDDDDNDWNDDDNKDLDDHDNKDNDTDADNGDGGGSFLRCSVDPETPPYGRHNTLSNAPSVVGSRDLSGPHQHLTCGKPIHSIHVLNSCNNGLFDTIDVKRVS